MRLTIMTKLLMAVGAVLVILGIVSAIGINGMAQMRSTYEELERLDEASRSLHEGVTVTQELSDAVMARVRDAGDGIVRNELLEAIERFTMAMEKSGTLIVSEDGQLLLAALLEANATLEQAIAPVLQSGPIDLNTALQLSMVGLPSARTAVNSALNELIAYQDQERADLRAEAAQLSRNRIQLSIGVALIAIMLSVVGAVMMGRAISMPVRALAESAGRLASGDLTVKELRVTSNDEIGQVAQSFNAMVRALRELIREATESAESVAGSSVQLSAAAEEVTRVAQGLSSAVDQVAQGATSQSVAAQSTCQVVDELRSAIEQIAAGAQDQAQSAATTAHSATAMAAAIEDVVKKAQSVSHSSDQAARSAEAGASVVQQNIEGMGRVRASVQTSVARLEELGKLSGKIGQITTVISAIASQTNLLALNAAIEAARAGEHGRGFAVVADEVRKLAEQAAGSAKEIEQLISSIQTSAAQAVSATEQGAKETESGVQRAAEAARVLQEIRSLVDQTRGDAAAITTAAAAIAASSKEVVYAIESVAAVSEESTAASEEMAAGAELIGQSIGEIAAVSEENAATSEEVSASVEQLSGAIAEVAASSRGLARVAQNLNAQISRFRL